MADIAPAEGVIVDIEEDGAPAPAPAATDPDVVEIPDDDDDIKGLPKHAVPQPDGSVRLPLRAPVTLRYRRGTSGETREERLEFLHLHRLNGADMRAVSAASKEAMASVMIARSTRIPEGKFNAIYDRMDGADIGFAARVVDHFLSRGPRTGR